MVGLFITFSQMGRNCGKRETSCSNLIRSRPIIMQSWNCSIICQGKSLLFLCMQHTRVAIQRVDRSISS